MTIKSLNDDMDFRAGPTGAVGNLEIGGTLVIKGGGGSSLKTGTVQFGGAGSRLLDIQTQ